MRDRDYLWCALHLMLDDEEQLERLCPSCRTLAEEDCCPSCGGVVMTAVGDVNGSFDMEKFDEMERGVTL